MSPVQTVLLIAAIVICLALGGMIFMWIYVWGIAKKQYAGMFIRETPDKWARGNSCPENEEHSVMFNSGMEWGAANASYKEDIEIKFYRLSYPILNTSNLPLSGIYQPEQGNSLFPFENKFSNFDIGNLENFFSFNSSFGKVFLHEKLEGLIIFSNNSDNHITIKDLDINIIIEPIKDSKNKKQRKTHSPEYKISDKDEMTYIEPTGNQYIK